MYSLIYLISEKHPSIFKAYIHWMLGNEGMQKYIFVQSNSEQPIQFWLTVVR